MLDSMTGDVGEAAFLLEALSRGFVVSKPFGSAVGYDFILDNGKSLFKVQVKAANKAKSNRHQKNIASGFCIRSEGIVKFNILILYKINTKDFYIIPSRKTKAGTIRVGSKSKLDCYKNNWSPFLP